MFFEDPGTAFANIGGALRPGGRLVMMVWQAHQLNEWDVMVHRSLEAGEGPVPIPSRGADPFSLADPVAVTGILEGAGFAEVTFTDVCQPVYYGPDVPSALDRVRSFKSTSEVLQRLSPGAAARVVECLRQALVEHETETGVWFNSRAWTVAARRP